MASQGSANPFAGSVSVNPFAAASIGGAGAPNPFAASSDPFAASFGDGVEVDVDAPPGTYTYAMVGRGPEVSPEEVEVAHVASIEVRTVWDSNVLRVDHLTPPRSYFVGEEIGDAKTACDFFLPSEMLGATRAPVVVANGARASLVILPRSNGTVDLPGRGHVTLADLVASGQARPSGEVAGAFEFELPAGARARMELEHSGLVFEVSAVNAGKTVPAGMFAQLDATAYVYFALSVVLHLGIIASLALFMPRMTNDDAEAVDRDAMLMMQHMLDAAAEREQETVVSEAVSESQPGGAAGDPAKGPSGTMGTPTTNATGKRFAVKGPPENQDRALSKAEYIHEVASFGMIGLLNTSAGGDPAAPVSPWGRDEAIGADAFSARGNMMGEMLGESFGAGGLGLSGVGEMGGGNGTGVGIAGVGTVGNGLGGVGPGGFGHGHGHVGGTHVPHANAPREGNPEINGRIPREVIQRIVRQNFGRFRLCYAEGLRVDPNLAGRVQVKFVIDRSGGVGLAQDAGGSELPQNVVQCVVRGFSNLSFPAPEGGIVTVQYPITFSASQGD
jgi:hypothetical protein